MQHQLGTASGRTEIPTESATHQEGGAESASHVSRFVT